MFSMKLLSEKGRASPYSYLRPVGNKIFREMRCSIQPIQARSLQGTDRKMQCHRDTLVKGSLTCYSPYDDLLVFFGLSVLFEILPGDDENITNWQSFFLLLSWAVCTQLLFLFLFLPSSTVTYLRLKKRTTLAR
ncbi:hypothetical protein B0F90DRAFT_1224404 [Multifurca ochricompacta]|uniref:Uncharacterized protein n=1 Tax=Multifurca ochricompacta TaxID=376703 RepID=A0AAD4LYQ9_9AGAM|nr:hypothetical protein B0F90DRAFT_1224404 [Multifurca ochricompacta]